MLQICVHLRSSAVTFSSNTPHYLERAAVNIVRVRNGGLLQVLGIRHRNVGRVNTHRLRVEREKTFFDGGGDNLRTDANRRFVLLDDDDAMRLLDRAADPFW